MSALHPYDTRNADGSQRLVRTDDIVVPELERYWADPAYRAEMLAEEAQRRADLNAWFDDCMANGRAARNGFAGEDGR